MNHDEFAQVVDEYQGMIYRRLKIKSQFYARREELETDKIIARIETCSPIEALKGRSLKHFVNLHFMLNDTTTGHFADQARWDEVVGDCICDLFLLLAHVREHLNGVALAGCESASPLRAHLARGKEMKVGGAECTDKKETEE